MELDLEFSITTFLKSAWSKDVSVRHPTVVLRKFKIPMFRRTKKKKKKKEKKKKHLELFEREEK